MVYDRQTEDRKHIAKRVKLAKSGHSQTEIDEIFESQKEESLTLAQLREKERVLEIQKEQLALEKSRFSAYIQETKTTLDGLEREIAIKKNCLDDCNETLSLRKIHVVMDKIQKDEIDDLTYVVFLGWKNGLWNMKHITIPKTQFQVISEVCNTMLEEERKKKA